MLKNMFMLSDRGVKDMRKAIFWSVISDITLMASVSVLFMVLKIFIEPIIESKEYTGENAIAYILIALLIAFCIYIAFYIQYKYLYISVYSESSEKRVNMAETIRKLPLSFFQKKDLVEFTNTLMKDITIVENLLSHAVPQFIGSAITIVLISILLLIFDFKMGLSVAIVFPIAILIVFASRRIMEKYGNIALDIKNQSSDAIQEALDCVKIIKSYNIEKDYLKTLKEKLRESFYAFLKIEVVTGTFVMSGNAILKFGMSLTIFFGAYLFIRNEITIYKYIAFLLIASRIYSPIEIMLNRIAEIFMLKLIYKRMRAIENVEIQKGRENIELNNFNISFNNVCFSYKDDNNQVIKNISFEAKQNEVTAIVGKSGSGKSTLAKLAARFWDFQEGDITIGGVDIKTIEPETLLKNISVVFQDVILFNDTIYNNIKIGKRNATKEEIYKAAKLSQCDKFINNLKYGYETMLGENGETLSGGERQRISIARALLKNAPIILLDEITSYLDSENESLVQEAISNLIKNKTVIVIAHRLKTIRDADKIIVLDNGKILEEGKHEKLMQNNSLYSKLVSMQEESLSWKI